ncbi:hypothetical protein [Acaryochloris sp. 'Moss Beach']|uniref:hypothetical protein n=1 Tax=Acaryochloris sp. 'Moss Beach' TaxID=2740837 RepID=UPI001F1FFFE4|nr:hypothetical protein [Acaryochloris sp. 'Moss Beach']
MGDRRLFEVVPLNDETEKLGSIAEDLIVQGLDLEPTRVKDVYGLNSYSFRIEVKQRFNADKEINLVAKDYPGEIFELLESGHLDGLCEQFLKECLEKDVEGCLILLNDWGAKADKFYCRALSQFLKLMDQYERRQDLRLAVTMSKCERGELWPGRLDPEIDIFDSHLPDTKDLLQTNISRKNLQFFALSTFGVLDRNDPRPNRIEMIGTDGSRAVLRETGQRKSWKPYGMLDPLYWLNTGIRKEFKY